MSRGDIAYINLPLVPGNRMQGGRRPAVLISADTALQGNPMIMIVPLTSNQVSLRFPFTFDIVPSTQNGLTVLSIALVFQLCAADRTHVGSVIGQLEPQYLTKIENMVGEMLGLG